MTMHTTVPDGFPPRPSAGVLPASGRASTSRQGWQWPLPVNSVVAVLEHPVAARDLVRSLSGEPFNIDVESVSGPEGAIRIHAAFERQGFLERLVSHLNGHDEVAGLLETEAEHGATVVLIKVEPEHFPEVLATLHRYRPGFVETNGRWIRSSVAA